MSFDGIQSYPLFLPRNIDLGNSLMLQAIIDPNLQLSLLQGSVSIGLPTTITKTSIKSKDHNILFEREPSNVSKTSVSFIGGIENTIKQKDIWKETQDTLGIDTIPETNIRIRDIVEEVPDIIKKDFPQLDFISQRQLAVGNYYSMIRKRFGLHGVANPFRILQEELRARSMWASRYRYIRSVLKTDKILGLGDKVQLGWGEILKFTKSGESIQLQPSSILLNTELVKNKWWADTGIPQTTLWNFDGTEVEGVIYLLHKKKKCISA